VHQATHFRSVTSNQSHVLHQLFPPLIIGMSPMPITSFPDPTPSSCPRRLPLRSNNFLHRMLYKDAYILTLVKLCCTEQLFYCYLFLYILCSAIV